jgi:hypothetical protein
MMFLDLIYNLALLVALSIVSGFIDNHWKRSTKVGALLQGALFGGAAIIGMLRPTEILRQRWTLPDPRGPRDHR